MRDLGVQVEGAPCPGFFRPDAEIGLFVVELDRLVLAFMSLVLLLEYVDHVFESRGLVCCGSLIDLGRLTFSDANRRNSVCITSCGGICIWFASSSIPSNVQRTRQQSPKRTTLRDSDLMSICSGSVLIFLFCSTGLVLFVIDPRGLASTAPWPGRPAAAIRTL